MCFKSNVLPTLVLFHIISNLKEWYKGRLRTGEKWSLLVSREPKDITWSCPTAFADVLGVSDTSEFRLSEELPDLGDGDICKRFQVYDYDETVCVWRQHEETDTLESRSLAMALLGWGCNWFGTASHERPLNAQGHTNFKAWDLGGMCCTSSEYWIGRLVTRIYAGWWMSGRGCYDFRSRRDDVVPSWEVRKTSTNITTSRLRKKPFVCLGLFRYLCS